MLPVVPGSPSPSDTATPNRRPAPGTMLRLASLVGLVILAAAPGLARGAGTVPAPPTAGAGASSTGAQISAFGTFTDTEALVVRRAFAGFMAPPFACGDDVAIGDDSWSFSCRYAAGHGLWVTLSRSDTLEAARAAFDAARGDQPETTFQGFPAAAWQRDEQPENPYMPLRYRYHTWVARQWLFVVETFDDTITGAGPAPTVHSEALFEAATAFGLLLEDPADPEAVEALVLREALGDWLAPDGCPGEVLGTGWTWSLTCGTSGSSAVRATIRRYGDAAAAQLAFEAAGAQLLRADFHGRAAFAWRADPSPYYPRGHRMQRGHTWLADRWVFTSEALDDGSFDIAPAAESVSEAVFPAATEHGLVTLQPERPRRDLLLSSVLAGGASAVAVDGARAYVAEGRRLRVLDASDPANVQALGEVVIAGTGEDIILWRDRAIVALGEGGLTCVDVSDPTAPTIAAAIRGRAWSLELADDLLFVSEGPSGRVWWTDLTRPGWLTLGAAGMVGAIGGIDVSGRRLYMVSQDGGMQIVDVSDPTDAATLGGWTDLAALDVAVIGQYAYVVTTDSIVLSIDVSDPTAPAPEIGIQLDGRPQTIEAIPERGLALAGLFGGGAAVLDLTDPRQPSPLGTYLEDADMLCARPTTPTNLGAVIRAEGDTAFLAERGAGLHVVSLADPARPVRIGGFAGAGCVEDVQAAGGHVFAARGPRGLQVYRDDGAGALVEVAEVGGITGHVLHLSGRTLYATSAGGFVTVDVGDPAHPQMLAQVDIEGGFVSTLYAVDETAYVGVVFRGILIYDVGDPRAPRLLGEVAIPGYFGDLRVAGGYAYVGEVTFVRVIDVSDPAAPRLVATAAPPVRDGQGLEHIRLVGHHVLALGPKLGVVDVADPLQPRIAAAFECDGSALDAAGDLAFLAGADGLSVLDVTDPAAPRIVGHLEGALAAGAFADGARSVVAAGDRLYLALGEGGLAVLDQRPNDATDDLDRRILSRVASAWTESPAPACPVELESDGQTLHYRCNLAAGHQLGAWIRAYPTWAEAQAALEEASDAGEPVGFHGFAAARREYDEQPESPAMPLRHRELAWRTDNRLYGAWALDDILPAIAPDPQEVADRLYEAAMLHGRVPGAWSGSGAWIEPLSALGGAMTDVFAVGERIYVGEAASLAVYDRGLDSRPVLVRRLRLPAPVQDVVVGDEAAYVALGGSGLLAVDLATWQTASRTRGPDEFVADLELADGKLYSVGTRLTAYAVGSSMALVELGSVATGYARDVRVSGGHAYLATLGAGMPIVDVSDPARMRQLGTYPGEAWGIGLVESYALVSDGHDSIAVVDVSDPASPARVAGRDLVGLAPREIAVEGRWVYVALAAGRDAVTALEMLAPDHLPERFSIGRDPAATGRFEARVQAAGGLLYAMVPGDGASAWDMADMRQPVARVPEEAIDAGGVFLSRGHAYVSAGDAGLAIIDFADPAAPTRVGTIDEPFDAIGGSEDVLVAMRDGDVHPFGLDDPANPTRYEPLTGVIRPADGAEQAVVVEDGYAYVTGGELFTDTTTALAILDVRHPYNVRAVGTLTLQWPLGDLDVEGRHVYALDALSRLVVVDVADPTAPAVTATYRMPGLARRLAVDGDHAYVADYDGMLQVIDVSDPHRPRLVGAQSAPAGGDVAVAGRTLFLAGRYLSVLDVRSPRDPLVLAEDRDQAGVALDADGGLAVLAGLERGVAVARLHRPASAAYLPLALRGSRMGQ